MRVSRVGFVSGLLLASSVSIAPRFAAAQDMPPMVAPFNLPKTAAAPVADPAVSSPPSATAVIPPVAVALPPQTASRVEIPLPRRKPYVEAARSQTRKVHALAAHKKAKAHVVAASDRHDRNVKPTRYAAGHAYERLTPGRVVQGPPPIADADYGPPPYYPPGPFGGPPHMAMGGPWGYRYR